ncbi:MAG: glycosyl hydrolase family 28 protein [Clostridia bacterium]
MYISVKDFGAKGDGVTVDTLAIQKAINETSEKGETLYFPAGTYVTSTLFLKDFTNIHLSQKAVIQSVTKADELSDDIPVVVEAPSFTKCLIYAKGIDNITISGKGKIDGMGQCFPTEPRPMLIRFENCKNITFTDVFLTNAASWCFHLILCEDILMDRVKIYSHAQHNNDGFDIDSCKNMRISNCDINTQDDSICPKSTTDTLCENITITGCNIKSDTAALKLGTSSKTGFRNIVMTGCNIYDCMMGTIKLLAVDGGIIENVVISDIAMHNVGSPLFVRLGKRNLSYDIAAEMDHGKGNDRGPARSLIRNVMFTNIVANVNADKIRNPIMITGLKEKSIENITISNLDISFCGGGTKEDAKNIVDDDPYKYPEQSYFGVLPIWGIYARHVEELNIENVKLRLLSKDERSATLFENVTKLQVFNSKYCDFL